MDDQCAIKRNYFSICGHLDPLSKCEHPHELLSIKYAEVTADLQTV